MKITKISLSYKLPLFLKHAVMRYTLNLSNLFAEKEKIVRHPLHL